MNDNMMLAELLFPNIKLTPEDMEKRYPERNLKEGSKVTRLAPSPTGFLHFGNLFAGTVAYKAARTTDDGVFFINPVVVIVIEAFIDSGHSYGFFIKESFNCVGKHR